MLLRLQGYDVEIKAKRAGAISFNHEDTLNFLNALAIVFNFAGDRVQKKYGVNFGYDADFDTIHSALAKLGLYDEIRERRSKEHAKS